MIMSFIVLEKGTFLEDLSFYTNQLMHGGFSTNLRPLIHSAALLFFHVAARIEDFPGSKPTVKQKTRYELPKMPFPVFLSQQ